MARGISTLLTSSVPDGTAPTDVTIGHIQLRDVLICPHEKGAVCYPQGKSIVEHDLTTSEISCVTTLGYTPNSLSSLSLDSDETLLAAGGQEAELHLSLYASPSHSRSSSPPEDDDGSSLPPRNFSRQYWRSEVVLDQPASINNSVHLTSLSLCGSHESSAEPRVVISNNDKTVKFYDVALRRKGGGGENTISHRLSNSGAQRLSLVGHLKLDVPVNHSSISPDGRTLLSVGDSPDIYLHRITGGSRISFTTICQLSLSSYINTPSYIYNPHAHANSAVAASFSTAFSANGSKFAVASQEGVVVVWDVRSTKPLKVIQTDKSRRSADRANGNGNATGWLYDAPWDWSRGISNAPGWGVRSVKFSPDGVGREVMTFTEHTSLLHVVDARTFESEEIVRVPNFDTSSRHPRPRSRSSSPPIRVTSASPSQDVVSVPPPPPRIRLLSGALEDAFRIPISDPSSRRRRHTRRVRGTRDDGSNITDEDPDVDGIVVIPPLGDLEVETDVRRLLSRRTSHARTRPSYHNPTLSSQDDRQDLEDDRDREDEMDIDDYEAECLSSHTPSRAASPALPTPSSGTVQALSTPGPTSTFTSTTTVRLPMPSHIADHPLRLSRPALQRTSREHSEPYSRLSVVRSASRRYWRSSQPREDEEETPAATAGPDVEQDLAGLCFDPTGEYVYVAAAKGICTWRVRGAEKSWWVDSAWA